MEFDVLPIREEEKDIVCEMVIELNKIQRNHREAAVKIISLEQGHKMIADWLERGALHTIKIKNSIIGFIAFHIEKKDMAVLEEVYLSEDFRGKGLCRPCISRLELNLQKEGINRIVVNIVPRNKYAIQFYRECGFEVVNYIQLSRESEKQPDLKDIEIQGTSLKYVE